MKINLLCTDPKRGGRVSAGIIEDGVFIRKVDTSKHLIRKYRAFGIQKEIAELLRTDGVKELNFISATTKWVISIEKFVRLAFQEDLGHGEQMIIALSHMTETRRPKTK